MEGEYIVDWLRFNDGVDIYDKEKSVGEVEFGIFI